MKHFAFLFTILLIMLFLTGIPLIAQNQVIVVNPDNGLTIQEAINMKFTAEMKKDAAVKERDAARIFAQAKESIKAQKLLDAQLEIMKAQADAIRQRGGGVPNVISSDAMQSYFGYMLTDKAK